MLNPIDEKLSSGLEKFEVDKTQKKLEFYAIKF